MSILLEARDLRKHYVLPRHRTAGGRAILKAVDGVSFAVRESETLGIVGESGCGKSTTARLLLRLDAPTGGRILFDGEEVQGAKGRALRRYRTAVQAVFQDPYSALDPRMRVRDIVGEPLVANRVMGRPEIRDRVAESLAVVGLDPAAGGRFPHEFSGGQRQRIAIARGLALRPRLVILDEPVSALDVSIRAQILNLLQDLQDRFKLAYVLISHDLDVIAHMCRSIAVMYLGRIVEIGASEAIRSAPRHPYTQALFSARLPIHPDAGHARIKLAGEVPSPIDLPSGCRFRTRCPLALASCAEREPALRAGGDGHATACHLVEPAARSAAR